MLDRRYITAFLIYLVGCGETEDQNKPVNTKEALELTVETWEQVTGTLIPESIIKELKAIPVIETTVRFEGTSTVGFYEFSGTIYIREYNSATASHKRPYSNRMATLCHEYVHALAYKISNNPDGDHKNPLYWRCEGSIERLTADFYGGDVGSVFNGTCPKDK
jgi:hypothetical protein